VVLACSAAVAPAARSGGTRSGPTCGCLAARSVRHTLCSSSTSRCRSSAGSS